MSRKVIGWLQNSWNTVHLDYFNSSFLSILELFFPSTAIMEILLKISETFFMYVPETKQQHMGSAQLEGDTITDFFFLGEHVPLHTAFIYFF